MDIVVFTGRMPVDELKRDKPAEYEALVASGQSSSSTSASRISRW